MAKGARPHSAESVVALGRDPRDDVRTLKWVRALDAAETVASERAKRLLDGATEGAAFAGLTFATDDLHEQIERLEGVARHGEQEVRNRLRRLQHEFKAWLSAFKSFEDRTASWLSRELGKDHAAIDVFRRALSREFDQNFAYRMCCALRNASEHSGDVINRISTSSALAASVDRESLAAGFLELTEDQIVDTLFLGFDGPKLALQHPRMRAATRAEFAEMTAPVALEAVVGAGYLSCMRAQAELFIELWPELSQAADLVEGYHQEALGAGGQGAAFVTTD